MDVDELLRELERTPGPDLEHKLLMLVERWREDDNSVSSLRCQIQALKDANDCLEEQVNALRDQVARTTPEPVNNYYTIEQFMVALASKMGRTYGWRTDYVKATHETPGCQKVETDDIQKWQKERRVPDWAYQQIEMLEFRVRMGRTGPEWKEDEVEYLIGEYMTDPHQPNALLAEKCMQRFGRDITEQAIKGAIYRLGQSGRLPLHRPKR